MVKIYFVNTANNLFMLHNGRRNMEESFVPINVVLELVLKKSNVLFVIKNLLLINLPKEKLVPIFVVTKQYGRVARLKMDKDTS